MEETMNEEPTHQEKTEHEKHEKTIIVNTHPHHWEENEISFDQVVSLAYDGKPPSGPDVVFIVKYREGEHSHKVESLAKGNSVHVKNGMIFNVSNTNRS